MTYDLKPCPFCGSRRIEMGYKQLANGVMCCFYAYCHYCEAQTDIQETEENAVTAWNMRNEPRRADDEQEKGQGAQNQV